MLPPPLTPSRWRGAEQSHLCWAEDGIWEIFAIGINGLHTGESGAVRDVCGALMALSSPGPAGSPWSTRSSWLSGRASCASQACLAPLPLPVDGHTLQYTPCATHSIGSMDPGSLCRTLVLLLAGLVCPDAAQTLLRWPRHMWMVHGHPAQGPLCPFAMTMLLSTLLVSGQNGRPRSSRTSRAACKWESCRCRDALQAEVGWDER